jgi:hypothetical protein
MSDNKIMTSIKISKSIHTQLLQTVVAQGYGLRGKSKWIIDAICEFLNLSPTNYVDLVDIANEMDDLTEVVSIRLPKEVMSKIEHGVIVVRKQHPSMEGVKSNIIRAAIIQKLLRK